MIQHSQPFVTPNLADKIGALVSKGDFVSGERLDNVLLHFESKFHQDNFYITQSGTQALYWILSGLDLSEGDEVILPSYVCHSVYDAVIASGLNPVLCDIDSGWHMSSDSVEQKITKKTKAVIVVNLFGMYLDCSQFRFPGVVIINDLCQAFDVLTDSDRDHGDFAFFSFHPTKFINAGGGGGFSCLNEKHQFENLVGEGYLDSYLSNMNLLILEEQLKVYDDFVSRREEIAKSYFNAIPPEYTKNISRTNNSYYRFPLTQERASFSTLQTAFADKGVKVTKGVDDLIHRRIGLNDKGFPNSINAFNTTLSIPIYPSLEDNEIELIANVTSEILNG